VHPTAGKVLEMTKLGSFPAFWDGPTVFSYRRDRYDGAVLRFGAAGRIGASVLIRPSPGSLRKNSLRA